MAYDEVLAARVRSALGRRRNLVERKMFGGLAFMLSGNMACGIAGDSLMLRLGEAGVREALDRPHTREWDLTAKPINSFVVVSPAGYASDHDLHDWIERAVAFASSLPPK